MKEVRHCLKADHTEWTTLQFGVDESISELVPAPRELGVDFVLGVLQLVQERAAHVGLVLRTGHFASGEPPGKGVGSWKAQILTS